MLIGKHRAMTRPGVKDLTEDESLGARRRFLPQDRAFGRDRCELDESVVY